MTSPKLIQPIATNVGHLPLTKQKTKATEEPCDGWGNKKVKLFILEKKKNMKSEKSGYLYRKSMQK